jgi:hypothetical protein
VFAVATVIIAVIVSILIARIATVALTVTGLSREAARFEARAALTNTGLSTRETERAVDHPVRRRIIMWLMLLGNAGIVTIVATFVLSFTNTQNYRETLGRLALLVAGLVAVVAVASNDRVDRALTRVIARALGRYTELGTRDYARLLKLSGAYAVSEKTVNQGDWVVTDALVERHLTDEGVVVLGITREDGSYIGVPRSYTPVRPGDTLILYGRTPELARLDARKAGPDGDEAHDRAVAEHRLILNAEHYGDPAREAS